MASSTHLSKHQWYSKPVLDWLLSIWILFSSMLNSGEQTRWQYWSQSCSLARETIENDSIRISNATLFSHFKTTTGWIACSFLLVALVFSKAFVPLSSHWMEALLSTINHTIWSMILVWIIVASLSKHRGMNSFFGFFSNFNSVNTFSCVLNWRLDHFAV